MTTRPQKHGLLVALLAEALLGASAAAEMSCVAPACHGEKQDVAKARVVKLYEPSAHAQAGVTCLECHGGDPTIKDETSHVTDNFQRPDKKQAIAELCARCHSDVRRMNPYGLPTDQLARYKTSKHGEQLFEHGDQKVAVCTDCHGAHDILKVGSPQSRTYPPRIPDTCGRCHSDAKLMGQYKIPADVVEKYKSSYHAEMLYKKGDLSAPTCVTCHGNHGAVPPGAAVVGQVCGKCHIRQRELFEQSLHAPLVQQKKFDACVSCHGNHEIQKASVGLYELACTPCHAKDKDAKALALRDQLSGLLRGAQAGYAHADARVHEATVQGLPTEDEQIALQEANTAVKQLEVLQHALSIETLKPVAAQGEKIVTEILAEIARLRQIERWKRLALVPIWAFLVMMAVVFWAKRRQIERRDGR